MNQSRKDFILISLTLFTMFFGAGNLIFPPMLGNNAGTLLYSVLFAFIISAVIFPILGVLAVAKSEGLANLCLRVGKRFKYFYITFVLLSIGPLLAIPRNATLPFELTIYPLLSNMIQKGTTEYALTLFAFTTIFFITAYYFSVNPSKLVNRLGKMMSPILIALILLLFVRSMFVSLPAYSTAKEAYVAAPMLKGFIDGYETLDVVAAITFGSIILAIFKNRNLPKEKLVKTTALAGVVAGSILAIIYFMTAHLGASMATLYPNPSNGADILRNVSFYLLGDFGFIVITLIFTISCLNVAIGLLTSCAHFFHELYSKITYQQYLIACTLVSYLLANYGLSNILNYSIPVLLILYPPALVLISLTLPQKWIGVDSVVYKASVYTSIVISFIATIPMIPFIKDVITKDNFLLTTVDMLPFAKQGLAWLIPVLVIFVVTFGFRKLSHK